MKTDTLQGRLIRFAIFLLAVSLVALLLSAAQFAVFPCNYARGLSFVSGVLFVILVAVGVRAAARISVFASPAEKAVHAVESLVAFLASLGAGFYLLLSHMCP